MILFSIETFDSQALQSVVALRYEVGRLRI